MFGRTKLYSFLKKITTFLNKIVCAMHTQRNLANSTNIERAEKVRSYLSKSPTVALKYSG